MNLLNSLINYDETDLVAFFTEDFIIIEEISKRQKASIVIKLNILFAGLESDNLRERKLSVWIIEILKLSKVLQFGVVKG